MLGNESKAGMTAGGGPKTTEIARVPCQNLQSPVSLLAEILNRQGSSPEFQSPVSLLAKILNRQGPGFFSRISVHQNHRQGLRSPDPTSSFSSNRQSSRLAPLEFSGPLSARIFTSIDTCTHTAISVLDRQSFRRQRSRVYRV